MPHVYLHVWTLYVVFKVLLVPKPLRGQLRKDKECPLSGVTNSVRVWRKVPESDVHSVLVRFKLDFLTHVNVIQCLESGLSWLWLVSLHI